MTLTPMTPEMWEEAMKYPERYCIPGQPEEAVLCVKRTSCGYPYHVNISRGDMFYESDGALCTGISSWRITRRPDAPPMEKKPGFWQRFKELEKQVNEFASLGVCKPAPYFGGNEPAPYSELTPEQVALASTPFPISQAAELGSALVSPTPEQRLTERFPHVIVNFFRIGNGWLSVFAPDGMDMYKPRVNFTAPTIDECINLFLEDAK